MDHVLSDYRAAIDALFARTTNNMKFGLERTIALLELLGNPQDRLHAIHVAGTNGKGSVVATCDALLRATGRSVGRYTSPHLIDFRERITIDGVPISEGEILAFLERWTPEAERMGATFFELTTSLAFDWFASKKVDIAVIETGLGGRLDSTNVLRPMVATVTSIGLDHTELLGNTLGAIAREKGGIFKRGVPAVIGETNPEIVDVLKSCANVAGAQPVVVVADRYQVRDLSVSEQGTVFTLRAHDRELDLTTPLLGQYQARNTAVAVATLDALGDDYLPEERALKNALRKVFLPGRFQRSGKTIFDVAHNPAGAHVLVENLRALRPARPCVALMAVLSDKDWRGMIEALAPAVDRFIFTNAPSAPENRRWDPADAAQFARSVGAQASALPELDAALTTALETAATVLVTGSFHTVGDAMSRLQVSPFAA